jgi:hypothetical protein
MHARGVEGDIFHDLSSSSLRNASQVFLSITPSSAQRNENHNPITTKSLYSIDYSLTIAIRIRDNHISRSKLDKELMDHLKWRVVRDCEWRLIHVDAKIERVGSTFIFWWFNQGSERSGNTVRMCGQRVEMNRFFSIISDNTWGTITGSARGQYVGIGRNTY